MMKKAYYIGMDVHKDTVQMAVFEETGDEPIYERRLRNDVGLLIKEVTRFSQERETEAAYEAGSLGYVIQRAMEGAGITCYVLPANKVAGDAEVTGTRIVWCTIAPNDTIGSVLITHNGNGGRKRDVKSKGKRQVQ